MSKSTLNLDFPQIPSKNRKDISIIRETGENPYSKKRGIYSSMFPPSKRLLKNNSSLLNPTNSRLLSPINQNGEEGKEKKKNKGKEFYNKLSLERINFQFEEYGE